MLSESLQAQQAIIEQTMQTNELATAISLATDQQRLASLQVADTMREFSRIIGDISVGSQQYRLSVSDLAEVVQQLNNLTDAFLLQKSVKPTLKAGKQVAPASSTPPKPKKVTSY